MTPQKWLTTLAREVASYLEETRQGTGIAVFPKRKISASESNTKGWYVTLGRLRLAGGGTLTLYYDHFARTTPALSVCYSTTSGKQAVLLSKAPLSSYGKAVQLGDAEVDTDPFIRLREPLRAAHYGRPMLELYPQRKDFFLSLYLPDKLRMTQVPKQAVHRAAEFFVEVARGVTDTAQEPDKDEPYSQLNRATVKRHLVRERSSKLATAAKKRDGYTCQICGLNFGKHYGELGSGFAEAHHVVPLASPKAKGSTTVDDLITVCSNCHRMLHRMSGESEDITKLRRIVAKHGQSRKQPGKG